MIIIASVYGVTIDEIIVRDVIEVEYENEEAKSLELRMPISSPVRAGVL